MKKLKKILKSTEEINLQDEIDEKVPNTPYVIEVNASPSRRFIQNLHKFPTIKNNMSTKELAGPKVDKEKQLEPIFLKEINEHLEFSQVENSIFPGQLTPIDLSNTEENKDKEFSKFHFEARTTSPNSMTKCMSKSKNSENEVIPHHNEIDNNDSSK